VLKKERQHRGPRCGDGSRPGPRKRPRVSRWEKLPRVTRSTPNAPRRRPTKWTVGERVEKGGHAIDRISNAMRNLSQHTSLLHPPWCSLIGVLLLIVDGLVVEEKREISMRVLALLLVDRGAGLSTLSPDLSISSDAFWVRLACSL